MADPRELLAAWEIGLALPASSPRRAVLLHALARPGRAADDLLGVPVGTRDADLLGLRAALFGDVLSVRTGCPACGADLEFDVDARGLAATAPTAGPEPLTDGDWSVRFRLPTPADLLAVGDGAAEDPRRRLAARLVVEARRGDRAVPADRLPERVVHLLAEAVAAADPAADISFAMACPDCGGQVRAQLDIATYLWDELDSWARTTLADVHALASSYGWTEPDVLALSPLRRRYYLELAGHG
ncbi:hypothetical protein [Streptomyces sp. DSM 15324]|uniref:hypothetical protein n=1 Tax=Streptomyces sp. DSM 15324 TaxID=1739111 RepID=UPI000749F244|nr:hypothetical protein [Streptomyces sp. DSM 15324]KUO08468.1 hypothetical protein AQJ58_31230 [Streptomyces sp. DSM 15324]